MKARVQHTLAIAAALLALSALEVSAQAPAR